MIKQIGFIGFGLIGGSLAKSIRKYGLAEKLIAYDLHQAPLYQAINEGVLDYVATSLEDGFELCDLIFLCCPVKINIEMFNKLVGIVHDQCIITDVGSTKCDIHNALDTLNTNIKFVGGHPMTGSEKSGYEASSSQLFENIFYILTPSKTSRQEDVDVLKNLVIGIDSIPLIMDASIHDKTTASISHVPHVLAALIVNAVKHLDTDHGYMHTLAAGGFKDITRIASASPVMWQQICLSNKEPILDVLDYYKTMLITIEHYIKEEDAHHLFELFSEAQAYRNTFNDTSSGIFPRQYSFSVDVEDEPGIIAKIATLLSEAKINIKNIGIINNREIDNGVLNILFEDQSHMDLSITLLRNLGYTIYT
ncbi:prephenate dehydrogenase [Petrocella sp. FN5]|uniref:prephenate dehydrogenase n=1 Tax=Petrocella sp. FN5 TaxID=3032002 RepID=UPI0023DBC615|nr:prephenate dehydrogenase [Petrocella sp. FN5]MDF1616257.1 prephenate dehydrogenase [Petrocella sp. FN5]